MIINHHAEHGGNGGSGTSYKTVKVTDYIKVNSNGVGNTIQDVTSLK